MRFFMMQLLKNFKFYEEQDPENVYEILGIFNKTLTGDGYVYLVRNINTNVIQQKYVYWGRDKYIFIEDRTKHKIND